MMKRLRLATCLVLLLAGLAGCADISRIRSTTSPGDALDIPLPPDAQRRAMQNEKEEQYLAALAYWKHAAGAISTRITALSAQVKTIAEEHAQNGVALFEVRKAREASREFLEALRYDPSNGVALDYLKNRYEVGRYLPYTVEENDSFIKIAEKVYGSATYDFAIMLFSDTPGEADLVAGATLSLAALDSFYSPVLLDYRKNIGSARKLFKAGQYEEAAPLALAILEDNPGDAEASYIVNMSLLKYAEALQAESRYDEAIAALSQVAPSFKNVQKNIEEIRQLQGEQTEKEAILANAELFEQGKKLYVEGRYLEALNAYRRIDGSYQGVDRAVLQVSEKLKMQAEMHYKNGVKFFVEEDLTAAISEWETALQLDPDNSNALNSIEKARNLLQKVKEIQ